MSSDTIFIVGQNGFDAKIAYYHKNKGNIRRIASGVYIREGLTKNEESAAIRLHACRIAKYIHPNSILSGSSAYHHGPVGDTITLCSDMKYPTKMVEGLKIRHMYVKSPYKSIPHEIITVKDPSGEISVKTLTDEMIIIQAFTNSRLKNSESSLSIKDLTKVVERAMSDKGKEKLLNNLSIIADNLGYQKQFDEAKLFIERLTPYSQEKKYLHEYGVYWNKREIAGLTHDGKRWEFEYSKNFNLPISLSTKTKEGKVPFFIESLIPEGHHAFGHAEDGDLSQLKGAERYTSNIVIRPRDRKNEIIVDTMEGSLSNFCNENNQFTGRIEGFPSNFSDEFYPEIGDIVTDAMAPRISGCQVKVPANLSKDGVLSPAIGKSFTHIVKLPAPGEMGSLGAMEWYTMALAYLCEVQTESFAVTEIEGLGPVFVAERFDIKASKSDEANYLCEDFCSAFGMTNGQKYDGEMSDVANLLLSVSTSPKEDARMLLKQTAFSWLVSNSDMHLKNLMFLKKGNKDMSEFESIRLSPAYDIMCTRIYSQGRNPSAAMQISGNRSYTAESLYVLAKHLDIPKDEAESILKTVLMKIPEAQKIIDHYMPDAVKKHPQSMQHILACQKLIEIRSMAFIQEMSKPKRNRFTFK